MKNRLSLRRSCVVTNLYPPEDFEQIVHENHLSYRSERLMTERKTRRLELLANVITACCMAIGIAIIAWVA